MPLDVAKAMHDQVWLLLEANTAFASTFKPGSRIKESAYDADGRDNIRSSPGDYPKVRVDVTTEDDNARAMRTFCMSSPNFSAEQVDYAVPIRATIRVKVVHDSTIIGDQLAAENAVRVPLLKTGHNLGLQWVRTFTIRAQRRREKTRDTGNTQRAITELILTVDASPMLSALTT